jgi:hypothetical protein
MSVMSKNVFQQFCNDTSLKNLVAATSEELRESDKRFFKDLQAMGAKFDQYNNTPDSARQIIRKFLVNSPVALDIPRGLVNKKVNKNGEVEGPIVYVIGF